MRRACVETGFLGISLLGLLVPKNKKQWLFSLKPEAQWGGNIRSVCDKALQSPDIKVVILCWNKKTKRSLESLYQNHISDQKLIITLASSPAGLWHYLRCGVCFYSWDSGELYTVLLPHWRRLVVNLWHGIPLKAIDFALPYERNIKNNRKFLNPYANIADIVIASSEIDKLAMSACMQHNPNKVWVTGLPRNDMLDQNFPLPEDLKQQEAALQKILSGRKLILYAPTWREWDEVNPLSVESNFRALLAMAEKHNAVLGIRRHPNTVLWGYAKASPHLIECDDIHYPEPQILLRNADIVITDYSSICMDFLLLDKPILGFCYDYATYMERRSFLYNFKEIFPGSISYDLKSLLESLDQTLSENADTLLFAKNARDRVRKMFFKYVDANASERVIASIRQIIH